MKISKLFHWLYATLMFLPLLVAPIFGIYSHRHTLDSYSVIIPQNQIVDFNQIVPDVYINGEFDETGHSLRYTTSNFEDKYYLKVNFSAPVSLGLSFNYQGGSIDYITLGTSQTSYNYIYSNGDYSHEFTYDLYPFVYFSADEVLYYSYNIFNLTQMFGSGNEPSIQQFNTWYSDDYYNYTLSRKEILQVGTITYDNTDIGSQFVYTIHNTIQNYFNMGDLFAFKGLSSWIQLAFFDGNFSLGFYIFYNLLLYWFVVSLLWLIFDVLMYVPNLAHRWLDRSSLQ